MARILVIDDDNAVLTLLERILRADGHTVTLATDGAKGLVEYRAAFHHLVILDLFMPDQDGLETLLALRREFPQAAVIVMSGNWARESSLQTAQTLGAIRTIEKPFAPAALLALIAEELDWIQFGIRRRRQEEADSGGAP